MSAGVLLLLLCPDCGVYTDRERGQDERCFHTGHGAPRQVRARVCGVCKGRERRATAGPDGSSMPVVCGACEVDEAALAAREDAPRARVVVADDRVETVARASWEAKRTNAERTWDVLVDKPKQKWRGHVAAVLAVVEKEVKDARWKAVERQFEKTAMLEQKLTAEAERDRYKVALEIGELPGDQQLAEEMAERMAVIEKLAGVLADPSEDRECDCHGEGIDHEGAEWTLCECVLKRIGDQRCARWGTPRRRRRADS
jgi:hypothetical protein